MTALDYIIVILYFLGLIGVSIIVSRKIKNSEDMFIAGRNSSWWLSGISSYMTIFSASTFVVWGGVAYKSGLVATTVAWCFCIACLIIGKWISGKWRSLRIKSPGEFLSVRFGHSTVSFYTIVGIIGRGVHTAVALYAVAVVVCAAIKVPGDSFLASTGSFGDAPAGNLSIWWALVILGVITLIYTIAGGFLAVLMTDVIQFGVLFAVVVFMLPLSFHEVGGAGVFVDKAGDIPGFFSGVSETYTWLWLVLWTILQVAAVGGDWPFVQRYISVPTVMDARKSTYLIALLYLVTPLIWYLPAMIYRTIEPGPGMDVDSAMMTRLGESAYVNMSKTVLMSGMLGMMIAAMLSATMSNFSGNLNVFANVFTYEIWGQRAKNVNADEKQRIRVGRIFTFFFGIAIVAISMLIPFAGGAEKMVVTLLTMVLCPLYIPSIWGLFSKRLTGKLLIWAMGVTYLVGFTAKFTLPSTVLAPSLIESISGCVLPILILSVMEIVSACRGYVSSGYEAIREYTDPDADLEPDERMKKATKKYSHLAVSCFCITLGVIAALLIGLVLAGDPKTLAVKSIVLWFSAAIMVLIFAYIIYRIVDYERR